MLFCILKKGPILIETFKRKKKLQIANYQDENYKL